MFNFKWKRDSKSSSFEPKTPHLQSVSLPGGQFSPIATLQSPPTRRPISNLLFRNFNPGRHNTSSVLERHVTPIDTSRQRTLSSPPRPPATVAAPRPIRPHPSQGPFVPIVDDRDRRPARTPLSVPSAQYLEEQIRRLPPEPSRPGPAMTQKLLDAEYDYPEEKKLREVVAKNQSAEINRVPSKAYKEVLAEERQNIGSMNLREGSKHHTVDFNDWKPVPVETDPPAPEKHTNDRRSVLKSAMKKTSRSSTVVPVVPPAQSIRREASEPVRGYHSENESRRKSAERSNPTGSNKMRITRTPSKAWLEVQQEEREEQRLRALGLKPKGPPGNPVTRVYGAGAFPVTNSATPSPVDSIHAPQDRRARRASHGSETWNPVQHNGNYISPYFRPNMDPGSERELWEESMDFSQGVTHGRLVWPLIDFGRRRRQQPSTPLIWFDAGFNPRINKYAVKAKQGPFFYPLTRDEETMLISSSYPMYQITIINRKLDKWVLHIHLPWKIRVIDIFRAIYDFYSIPLTAEEMHAIGNEALERCRRAWSQRCEDGPDFTHNEERKGFLRIDLLRGRRIFKGLAPIRGKTDHYELLFDEGH